MVDVRRILVIFVIAVLFSIFVFTSIEAVYPGPEYNDFCDRTVPPTRLGSANCTVNFDQEALQACYDEEGEPRYTYDDQGCRESWTCDYCQKEYNEARETHNFWRFIISALMGIIAIAIGMNLPESRKVNEWVGSGLMLGGLICVFVGTAMYFGDLHRFARPVVILLELLLVIYLAYTKLSD